MICGARLENNDATLPIMILATISWVNRTLTSLLDEFPMISQLTIEITLMQIKVILRPNLSSMYPERSPPIGEKIAVMEANHEACATVNLTSVLSSLNSGNVVAGYPGHYSIFKQEAPEKKEVQLHAINTFLLQSNVQITGVFHTYSHAR